MTYSQNDEQEVIEAFFDGKIGRFIDIGAYDGLQLSNTRRLLELGWSGVMVEPSPVNFIQLMANTVEFGDRAELVMAAMSGGDSAACLTRLYIDEHPYRGWSTSIHKELVERGSVMRPSKSKVWVLTLPIETCEGAYDFISLDAEWEDFAILKVMPKKMLDYCKLLCVEPRDLNEREEMKKFLLSKSFKVHHETPENLIVCHL